MGTTDDLPSVLRVAYEVFGRAGLPSHADACRHCLGEDQVRALLRTPFDALSREQVRSLRENLGKTFGGSRETRWFAPRLVASLRDGELSFTHELVGAAIRRAGWPEWPSAEVDALRAVTAAVVRESLVCETDGDRLDAVLASVALFETDLAPYLDVWSRLPRRERSLALLRLLPALGDAAIHGVRRAPWWRETPQAFAMLREHVLDPARLLEAAEVIDAPELGAASGPARIWLDVLSR